MSETNSQIAELQRKIQQLKEIEAQQEQAKLKALENQILQRKLEEERKAAEAQAEYERKVQLQIDKRRKEEEERLKIAAQKKADDLALEYQRNLLEEQNKKHAAEEAEVRRLSNLAFQHEESIRRRNEELARIQNEAFRVEEKPSSISDGKHPLSFLFSGREAGESSPIVNYAPPTPAPVQKKPELSYTQTDLQAVMAAFSSNNRPATYEIHSLLKEFDPEAILGAIAALRHDWALNHTMPSYQIEHIRMRLSSQETK